MAPGDQATADDQATTDEQSASGSETPETAVAQPASEVGASETPSRGVSHDGAESAEVVESAESADGVVPAVAGHDVAGHAAAAAPAAGTAVVAAAPATLIESTQIRRAIKQAEKRTDLNWSVFIGTLGDDPRAQAEARHAELGPAAVKSVLIAVDPAAHRLEIVTGEHARTLLDDRSCALAAASMTSTFAVRDLDGGIAYGILALVEHVRRPR